MSSAMSSKKTCENIAKEMRKSCACAAAAGSSACASPYLGDGLLRASKWIESRIIFKNIWNNIYAYMKYVIFILILIYIYIYIYIYTIFYIMYYILYISYIALFSSGRSSDVLSVSMRFSVIFCIYEQILK